MQWTVMSGHELLLEVLIIIQKFACNDHIFILSEITNCKVSFLDKYHLYLLIYIKVIL